MNRLHSHNSRNHNSRSHNSRSHNRQPHPNNHGRLHNILRRRRDRWQRRLPADSRDRQPALSNSRQCGRRNNRHRDRDNITSHSRNPTWDSSQYRNRLHNPHTGDTMGHIGRSRYSTLKNSPRIITPERMNPITVRRITRNIPIFRSLC